MSESPHKQHHEHTHSLRGKPWTGPVSEETKRFNYFLIDTGWNQNLSRLVRSYFPTTFTVNSRDSLYVLSPEQSIEVLKQAPYAIGHDPIILVYDLVACSSSSAGKYRGFRLNLGLVRHVEQAMARLQDFMRFVALHRTSSKINHDIRRELHREGFDGMVQILREATTEFL
jgi:hypothetical protein